MTQNPSTRYALLGDVRLRDVTVDDLPLFFEYQSDPLSIHMAAFTAEDPADKAAFLAHWAKILSDETITKKAIVDLLHKSVFAPVYRNALDEAGRTLVPLCKRSSV